VVTEPVRHDPHGFWIAEAGAGPPLAPLEGDLEADVVIVGGGFTGLWTAWHLLGKDPETRVVILESDRVGHGPSGRNGGFADALWVSFERLVEEYGLGPATDVARASGESVHQIGEFAESEGVDCWFRRDGYLNVSTSPSQDFSWRPNVEAMTRAGFEDLPKELDHTEVEAICSSPAFREGIFYREAATVQPARLAFGLRDRVAGRGALLFEHSPVRRIEDGPGGVALFTPTGSVRADRLVMAAGAMLAGIGSPLADRVTLASSHMVVSEPVPDLLDEIGWTGGQAISDCRSLLNYFRTTPDGRIAFGWGGGRIAAGGRRRGTAEVDPVVIGQVVRNAISYFPGLAGRRFDYAWGGPIDASATHLPQIAVMPSGRSFAAVGYTGNGVGPSQMIGRALASLTLGLDDRYSRLALIRPASAMTKVPPEPFRWAGGAVIRTAIERREAAEMEGRRPDPLSSVISDIPRLIGFHIGR
jgi:glycine/D-amino acid oxidase-like deaminating enzyme